MTVAFQLEGQEFTALNGGPQFRFTEAISLVDTRVPAQGRPAAVRFFRLPPAAIRRI
jgi:hypothetical protein